MAEPFITIAYEMPKEDWETIELAYAVTYGWQSMTPEELTEATLDKIFESIDHNTGSVIDKVNNKQSKEERKQYRKDNPIDHAIEETDGKKPKPLPS